MKQLLKFSSVAALLLCVNLVTIQSQDWPQWRGLNRDGKVTGFVAPATWPQQLKQAWKVNVGLGASTPALVNNKLYVFTRQADKELLLCIDAATGKQLWASEGVSTPAPTGPAAPHAGPRSSPAVGDGKVVTYGVNGIVSCFDAATGKLIWRNTEYTTIPQFYTSMSPLISDGLCITHLGGEKSGEFVAFNLADGSVKWKLVADGIGYASPILMTVDGTKQVVFQGMTKLVGVGFADGKLLWEFATPAGTGGRGAYGASTPVIDGQKVFYSGLLNGINALEIKKQGTTFTVNKLWSNTEINTMFNTPTLKDGFLYGFSNLSRLYCINATTGQTAWIDTAPHQTFGSIIDAGSVLLALSSTSNLVVLKPDGKAYSQVAVIKVSDNAVYSHPVVSGNRIFIKDSESLIMYTTN